MHLTLDDIRSWTTPTYFSEGQHWFAQGRVDRYEEKDGQFEGSLSIRDRAQICRFVVSKNGSVENLCPCRTSREEGLICGHVIAIALAWHRDHADPLQERADRVKKKVDTFFNRPRPGYIRRGATGVDAKLRLTFRKTWPEEVLSGTVHLIPEIEVNGRWQRPNQLHPTQVLKFSVEDELLLYLLEDIHEGPIPPVFEVTKEDLVQVLSWRSPQQMLIHNWPEPIHLHKEALLPMLTVKLEPRSGEIVVEPAIDLPVKAKAGATPFFILGGRYGWVMSGNHAWPLEQLPAEMDHQLFSGSMRIPREKVMEFVHVELPALEENLLFDRQFDPETAFKKGDAKPGFILRLKGGADYMTGTLHAVYGSQEVVAGGPDPAQPIGTPDPEDPLAYAGRDEQSELAALASVQELGFAARAGDQLGTVEGKTAIFNALSAARYTFTGDGWGVELNGPLKALDDQARSLIAMVGIDDSDTPDWFRLKLTLRSDVGENVTEARIRKALEKGEDFVEVDGNLIFLPREQARILTQTVAEAEPGPDGELRLSKKKCGFVQAVLNDAKGLPANCSEAWKAQAEAQSRDAELDLLPPPEGLQAELRSYQQYGLSWLAFLERAGFSGILSDEMGLGKTLQTLCWIASERSNDSHADSPSLIVCPASLIHNWQEEAAKFFPNMKTLLIEGTRRAKRWEEAGDKDLIIVSYPMLRRDLDHARKHTWAVVALDEAQHIKNPDTQNAKSAKMLEAGTRLVLTGTPMENSVRDLWSLFDFCMPGYLGTQAQFKKRFLSLIQSGGPGAASALHLLRQKLHPFILRRRKTEVAPDLPPRIDRIVYCDLLPEQRAWYNALEAQIKEDAEKAVSDQGFAKSRMNVLTGLMRLRQACCHPALLPQEETKELASGKLDMFFELLNEIMDGGSRVLVFSQFVSMLHVLRKELEEREISFAYLDGQTKNRQEEVHRFNNDESVPVFLISLMAGGTGLNLTGADVVIHFDPWWNPAIEDQATDRAHRIGQEKTVYAMKMISRDTIESRVLALQSKKRDLIDAALVQDEAVMEKLDWDDIKELLEI